VHPRSRVEGLILEGREEACERSIIPW
jgi:hypothetical protein